MLSAQKLIIHYSPVHCKWQELADSLTAAAHQPKYSTDIPSVPHTPVWILVKKKNKYTSKRDFDVPAALATTWPLRMPGS
jgi:hypothetical protein